MSERPPPSQIATYSSPNPTPAQTVLVLGAGPVGLAVCSQLVQQAREAGLSVRVVVVSQPPSAGRGITPVTAAHPRAAAYLQPFQIKGADDQVADWFRRTLAATANPDSAGGNGEATEIFVDNVHNHEQGWRPSWARAVSTGELTGASIPEPWTAGFRWETYAINPHQRHAELGQLAWASGVHWHTTLVRTYADVVALADHFAVDLVVDALGVSSGLIFQDPYMGAAIGHLWVTPNFLRDRRVVMADDDLKYVISGPRSIFIGGTYIDIDLHQLDSADLRLHPDIADSLDLALELLRPDLLDAFQRAGVTFDHSVGIRPTRSTGPRLEAVENYDDLPTVVHATGLGGSGWTLYWGMAHDAAKLIVNTLANRNTDAG